MSAKRGVHKKSPAKQSVKKRLSSSSAPTRRAGRAESGATKRQLAAQRAFPASAGYDVDAISEDGVKAFRERWQL